MLGSSGRLEETNYNERHLWQISKAHLQCLLGIWTESDVNKQTTKQFALNYANP